MTSFELFLSYHSTDRKAVDYVRQILNSHGVTAFIDHEDLVPGMPWPEALERAIGGVRAVAVFIGPEWGAWQKREVNSALERQVQEERAGRTFPVIPVLLPNGEITSGFLFQNTCIDLRKDLASPDQINRLLKAIRDDDRGPLPNPYQGLKDFREEHSRFFFGREEFSERLLEKVSSEKDLVAVIGPSGSGKSSIVHAGLLPLLRRRRPLGKIWDAISFTPGHEPFRRFAAALMPLLQPDLTGLLRLNAQVDLGQKFANGTMPIAAVVEMILQSSKGTDGLLIIVDQFEELITLTPENREKDPSTTNAVSFVKFMLDALRSGASIKFLLTLRADFYGHVIGLSRELSDRLEGSVVNVGPMERAELERAIVEPARTLGLEFEPGLVKRLLDDFANQPGELPLLEFALWQLWDNRDRDSRLMTHATYQHLGGVKNAINNFAHTQLEQFTPEERGSVKRIFSRLVRLKSSDEGEDTRQRVPMNELPASARLLVDRLANIRLLVTARDEATGEDTVEVAHEALIREWSDLRDWLKEDRKFLLWRQRLRLSLSEWHRTERDKGGLLHGALLTEAEKTRRSRETDLNDAEREFIGLSIQNRRKDILQRRRYLVAGAVLVVTVGILSAFLWQRVTNERRISFARNLLSSANTIANTDLPRLDQAALLAIESLNFDKTREAQSILRQAFSLIALQLGLTQIKCEGETTLSSRGAFVACIEGKKSVRVLSVSSGNDLLDGPIQETREIFMAAASPNGRFVAIGFRRGGFRLLEIKAKTATTIKEVGEGYNTVVAFSASGNYFAAGAAQDEPDSNKASLSTLHVIALSDRVAPFRQFQVKTRVLAVSFSPDDKFVGALREGDSSTVVSILSLTESKEQNIAGGAAFPTFSLSRGATWMTMPYLDKTVRVTNTENGTEYGKLSHQQLALAVAFSEDGKWVASGSQDGAARVMEASSGRLVAVVPCASTVQAVAFTENNDLVVVSADRTVRTVNVLHRPAFEAVSAIDISPRGTYLNRFGSNDRALQIVDRHTGKTIRSLELATDLITSHLRYSLDEERLIVTGSDQINVYDVKTGKLYPARDSSGVSVQTVSGDGKIVAQATAQTIRIFPVDSSSDAPRTVPLAFPNTSILELSPDGTLVAASGSDPVLAVFDAVTNRKLFNGIQTGASVSRAAFSPDGRYIAISTAMNDIILAEARTGTVIGQAKGANSMFLMFNQDGSVLATGGGGKDQSIFDVRLFETTTQKMLLQVSMEAPPLGMAFDNRHLDVLEDTAITRHYFWTEDLVEQTCPLITRPLSPSEWKTFMPGTTPHRICPNLP